MFTENLYFPQKGTQTKSLFSVVLPLVTKPQNVPTQYDRVGEDEKEALLTHTVSKSSRRRL